MGWLFYNHPVADVKAEIESPSSGIFTTSAPGHAYEVLDSAIVGNTYYAAVKRTLPDHPPYVFAAIFLFKNGKRSGFGYKDMDEGSGPYECACPLRILNKLSPLEDFPGGVEGSGYAAGWRERVREYHRTKATQSSAAKALKPGDTFKLAEPLTFTSGIKADTFTVTTYVKSVWKKTQTGPNSYKFNRVPQNRTAYQTPEGYRVHLSPRHLTGAVKIEAAA